MNDLIIAINFVLCNSAARRRSNMHTVDYESFQTPTVVSLDRQDMR